MPLRALLVDDSKADLYLLQKALLDLNENTLFKAAFSVHQLSQLMAANDDIYDIAIIEYFLPDGYGYDAVQIVKLRAKFIIMVSAAAIDYSETFEHHIHGFALKPLRTRSIQSILRGAGWANKMNV